MRRLLAGLAGVAVVAAAGALVVTATGTASADTNALLPMSDYPGGFVVDGVHKRVFVSVPGENKIIATDYAGATVGIIDGLPGVRGIALAPDSGHLYAAVTGGSAIVSIATATLTQAASYPTGAGTQPSWLAADGDHVWFSYSDFRGGDIGSVDLAATPPAVTLDQDDAAHWYDAPLVKAGPGHRLAAGDRSTTSGRMAVYDVSGGDLRQTVAKDDVLAFLADLQFTPDGSHLLVPGSNSHLLLRTTDLTQDGSYPADSFPNSVAMAPDGTFAGGVETGYGPNVYVFEPGATTPIHKITFPPMAEAQNMGGSPVDGGLAWEPGGTRLFALVENLPGVYWSLRVVDEPARQTAVVKITAPATGTLGKGISFAGSVLGGDPVAVDTLLTVTRYDLDSPNGTKLDNTLVEKDGKFTFVDWPTAGGPVTYKVSFAGDATHFASSGTATVDVARTAPTVTIAPTGSTYAYGTKQTFTAHLGTTDKNRTVEFWANPAGSDPDKLVKKVTVDSLGNATAVVTLTKTTYVTAVFTGDSRYSPKTVQATAYANVQVSTVLSRQYKTAKIGSTTYAYFHKTTNPLTTTTMTAYPGRKQNLVVQTYTKGAWVTTSSKYYTLTSKGTSAVELTGKHATGVHLRVRSVYVKTTSGDAVNATTYGAWKYYTFT